MSAGHVFFLGSPGQREVAARAVLQAPHGAVVEVRPQRRTLDQNALMWVLLGEISRAKPEGRHHTPEIWKCIFMNALGHEVRFVMGLEGEPFPVGFRSSKLTKGQMSDLIEMIYWYAAQHGVALTQPEVAS